jgi:hypothetical protein
MGARSSTAAMRSLVGGSATELLLGDDELEHVNGEQRVDADLTLVSTSRDAQAASPSQPQRRRRGHGCCTNVVLVCRLSTARRRRKPRNCGAFECAEEDSNLHPLSVDQALNLVTRGQIRPMRPDRPDRPRIWTEWTQRTIWMLPRMLPRPLLTSPARRTKVGIRVNGVLEGWVMTARHSSTGSARRPKRASSATSASRRSSARPTWRGSCSGRG